ncbi:MAG: 2-dehydropantoate 2-reductase N-terminal domain-containing protein [Myxococcota bacterium]
MSDEATIVGAGSVGLALAARLARAGKRVLLVARRREAAGALAERGLAAVDAASGHRLGLAVRAATTSDWDPTAGGPIFVCTRTDAVEAVAARAAASSTPFVTFQNDVESEEVAARHVPRVIGGVWRETSTRRADDCVCLQLEKPARAVVGLHPSGRDGAVDAVASLLCDAGLDVSVSETITRDKWLKLCINLMATPNALVRRPDHRDAAFVEVKVRLLEEAWAVLAAAAIEATPCDGRDRTLSEEIAFQREALARGTSARPLPLYNHVWTGLRSGARLEADGYHERVLALAARHGIEAPVNQRVLACLRDAVR